MELSGNFSNNNRLFSPIILEQTDNNIEILNSTEIENYYKKQIDNLQQSTIVKREANGVKSRSSSNERNKYSFPLKSPSFDNSFKFTKKINLSGINNNISVIKNEEKDDRDLMSSRLHDLYTNIPVNNYKYTPDLSNLISDMVSPRRNEKEDDLRKKRNDRSDLGIELSYANQSIDAFLDHQEESRCGGKSYAQR